MSRMPEEYSTGEHRPGSAGSKLSEMGRKRNSAGSLGAS